MKKIRLGFYLFFFLTALFCLIYSCFLLVPPVVINFDKIRHNLEKSISQKTGMVINFENPKLQVSPGLVYKFEADRVDARDKKNNQVILIEKISGVVDIKYLKFENLYADEIFFDGDEFRKLFGKRKNKPVKYNFNKLPELGVKKFVYKSDDFTLELMDVAYQNKKLTFDGEVDSHFLNHDVFVQDASFDILGNKIFADEVEISLGKSKIEISGDIFGKKDFFVKGFDLPVSDLEKTLLYYQKQQDPAKKFLENFRNYQGKADVDLRVKEDGIFGRCLVKDLSAVMVWFDIPVEFREVPFVFDKNRITSHATGKLGGEPVLHDLEIVNLGTPQKEFHGDVRTTLTKNFRYIKGLRVLNTADARVSYFIRNKKIDVKYSLDFSENSDVFYKNAFLGLRDKKRKFYFETLKDGDNLFVKDYNYSISEENGYIPLIMGDGLFIKQDGKLKPAYFNCKTNGYAPVSAIGALGRYIRGGAFRGNLKLDLLGDKLLGDFELKDTRFKNFHVKSAKVIASDRVKILAGGLFHRQKFGCELEAENQFGANTVHVYDLDLFLDKYIIKSGKKKRRKNRNFDDMRKKFYSRPRDFDVTIDNWNIRMNELRSGQIILRDIFLYGSLQNKIFEFTMNKLSFADGILEANGRYNFEDNSSSVDFVAKNINSNIAADTIFGLHNQIEGIANATLQLYTKNQLEDVQAVVQFSVDNGFLPKIGSTEFMLKNEKRVKLMDIITIDSELKNKKTLESDIKGFFRVDNNLLKDIKLTTQQQYLSLFIEGKYDMDKQYAFLNLYGKYNKEVPRGVKIVFIPLNWILNFVLKPEDTREFYSDKLKQIPSVDASEKNEKYFRVKMQGNLNQDSAEVEIKSIR